MTRILKQEINYLDSSRNRLLLIGFICLYSFIFITVYDPYNLNEWGKSYYLEFILIGAIIFLISQFVLRPIFRLKRLKVYSLLVLYLLEMLLIALSFESMYSPPLATFNEKINEYLITFRQIGLVVIVPYILFIWYMGMKQKLSSYKEIQYNTMGLSTNKSNELLIINGENDKVILAIKYAQLLCVKSAGNYLELFYLKGDKLAKELIRGSIKEFEAKVIDNSVIRVHRSYIVNIQHLSSSKKTKKGYGLVIQHLPNEVIPVSSSYKQTFEDALKKQNVPFVTV